MNRNLKYHSLQISPNVNYFNKYLGGQYCKHDLGATQGLRQIANIEHGR